MSLNISFIGNSNRLRSRYFPLLKNLGYCFKSILSRSRNQYPLLDSLEYVDSYKQLLSENPDVILVSLPANFLPRVIWNLRYFDGIVLLDTPIKSVIIPLLSSIYGIKMAVIEQFPFLPVEQFKAHLVAHSHLPKPNLIQHINRSHDYHFFAQARSALGVDPKTTNSYFCVQAIAVKLQSRGFPRYTDKYIKSIVEIDDQLTILHDYSRSAKSDNCFSELSLEYISEKAYIKSIFDAPKKKEYLSGFKNGKDLSFSINYVNGIIKDISFCDKGKVINWSHSFSNLSDQDSAIAMHFDTLTKCNGSDFRPLYSSLDSLLDYYLSLSCYWSSLLHRPVKFFFGKDLFLCGLRSVFASPLFSLFVIFISISSCFYKPSFDKN